MDDPPYTIQEYSMECHMSGFQNVGTVGTPFFLEVNLGLLPGGQAVDGCRWVMMPIGIPWRYRRKRH